MADKGILSQKLEASPFYLFVRSYWESVLGAAEFQKALELGVASTTKNEGMVSYVGNVSTLAASINKSSQMQGIDLVLYQSVGVREGSQGNNPWLFELPDPVSKVCWDNYVALPKQIAAQLGIDKDATVNIEANGVKYENVPAFVQPGQANNTVSLAVGF